MSDASFRLGINTGFAVNRFSEPESWTRIVGELGLKSVQFTADLLNPDLPAGIIVSNINRINAGCAHYGISISSTFTGAFTRVNHLAHPDADVRDHWVRWFKRYVDISVDLGAESMGSHFGIFTDTDTRDPTLRVARRRQNIAHWHEIADYARTKGLKFLTWEPMSISREQGQTIIETQLLQDEVNLGAPLPFQLCLDVDHGDVASTNPDDTDPYIWLKRFGRVSPLVHLKQSSMNKGGHWPFTAEHNRHGRITPQAVIDALVSGGAGRTELLFECSFREREPTDSTVREALAESVAFWRPYVRL